MKTKSIILKTVCLTILITLLAGAAIASGAMISGYVTADDTGDPIVNCDVDVWSWSGSVWGTAKTLSDGQYEIMDIPGANDLVVVVVPPADSGYLPQFYNGKNDPYVADLQSTLEGDLFNIDFILKKYYSGNEIDGRILDSDKKPIGGIYVNVYSVNASYGDTVLTDTYGNYKFFNLVPADDYVISVWYELEGMYGNMYYAGTGAVFCEQDAEYLQVQSSVIKNNDMILNFVGRSISGTIKDQSGNPIPNAKISIWSWYDYEAEHGYGETTSTANGAYTISNLLPTYDYIIEISKEGFNTLNYENYVDLTCKDQIIDFKLGKGASIKGAVYIGKSPAPEGIWVYAWSKSGIGYSADSITNGNGEYEIFLSDPTVNDYVIGVWYEGYWPAYYSETAANTTVYLEEEATGVGASDVVNRNIVLSTGLSIKGKVTYKGLPVPDIYVEAVSLDSYGWGSAITTGAADVASNYEISGLLPGTYTVTIYPSDFTARSNSVTLSANNITGFNFNLDNVYKISGHIYNLQPGVKASITAWTGGFYKTIEIPGPETTCTETDCSYTISELQPASDYLVEFYSDYYLNKYYNNKDDLYDADYVDLSASDQKDINFTLPKASDMATIYCEVIFPTGAQPGETAWIDVFSKFSYTTGNSIQVTLYQGNSVTYPIPVRKSNDYIVYVSSDKYKNQYYDQTSNWEDAKLIDTTASSPLIKCILSKGATIKGKIVDEKGTPKPGIEVEAWSESTGSWGYATTNNDGTFIIEGLDQANDFKVYTSWMYGSFYYGEKITSQNQDLATAINTAGSSLIENINLTLAQVNDITGTVKDKNMKPISRIWVSAWSKIMGTGEGSYTDEKGTYTITGLPQSNDYEVTVYPDFSMPYFVQTINNVSTGSQADVNFVLNSEETKNGHHYKLLSYKVEGIVQADNTPISNVEVVIWSDYFYSLGYGYKSTMTDEKGKYQFDIIGFSADSYSASDDYIIMAWPPEELTYVPYTSENLVIMDNVTHNITLVSGGTILGKVTANGTEIKDVIIKAYSPTGSWGETQTDKGGLYEITNLATASDYVVTAIKQGFITQSKTMQSTGTTIDFTLEASGVITGKVVDAASSKPISGVRIDLSSTSSAPGGNAFTDSKGEYIISDLRPLVEYTLTAYSPNYMIQHKVGKTGDKVDFMLSKGGANTEIEGSLTVPATVSVMVVDIFEKRNNAFTFFRTETIKNFADFKITGLTIGNEYKMLFLSFNANDDVAYMEQWADQDGICFINTTSEAVPQRAGAFKPGAATINFRYTPVPRNDISLKDTTPTVKVQNLHSTTHTPVEGDGVGNVPRTLSAGDSPNIKVEWDPSSAAVTDESYYQIFTLTPLNTENKINKRNAPSTPPSSNSPRSAISPNISGDNVEYYFYVAPVDSRGRIGTTSYLKFRIDSVGPRNASVKARDIQSATRTVTLELGATGATEMYISNIGYGEGGKWETFTQTKQWKLSEGNKVYVQFRDLSSNTSNALAIISTAGETVTDDLKCAINALKIITGNIIDTTNIQLNKDNRVGIESVIFHLQRAARLR